MSCEHTTFSLVFVKREKRLKLQTTKQRRLFRMSRTIPSNSTGVNGLKDLLNEHLMPQEFHVPASRGYGMIKLTLAELIEYYTHHNKISTKKIGKK